MKKWIASVALIVGAAGCGGAQQASVQSQPQTKPQAKMVAKAATKATDLAVCPTMLHPVPRDAKNSLKYAAMTVYFCCPDCRAKFKALAPPAQKARIQAAQKIAAKQSA